jgi:hypothetical protein
VRTVHRGHASATQYAALLAGLPRLPDELQLDAPDLIAPLRAIRERWPTRTIDCAERAEPRPFDRHWLVQARPALAAMFPALETLRLAPWRRDAAATHARLIGELPAGFPTLRRIVVDLHGLRAYEPGGRAELDEIAKLPLVEWLDPAQLPRWPPWPLARATAG